MLQADADQFFRLHAQRLQMTCQPIGTAVQLFVGQRLVAIDDCHGVRSPPGLRLEHFMEPRLRRRARFGLVPLRQDELLLRIGQQRQFRQPPSGVCNDALQQLPKMPPQTGDCGGVEQVRVVFQIDTHLILPLD